jgi:MerR family mercuric resistance operon transcriptional regulator
MPHTYTIARLASAAGVHVEAIRYYQRRKLIPEPTRPIGGVRRYTRAPAATKLQVVEARIRELRQLRKELAGLIASCDANSEGARSCPVIERLAS